MSKNKQSKLGFDDPNQKAGPVECFGKTFESDKARREHYLNLLAEQLKDPEFRKTPGFPLGTDEAILRMSDPPYYTACPNPFLKEFVRVHGRPYDLKEAYRREPFAVDVSVGKTDQLYRAHGYHTKVPHLAIVPSILHYTNPGDVILDGFCGSGMTGVAAQWCGTAPTDYRRELEDDWTQAGYEAPEWGARRAILGDLGPAATFITANYNIPFDVDEFSIAAQRILDQVENELGWMYETTHTDSKTRGRINYTVWSEVFSCPECGGEVVYLNEALDIATKKVLSNFPCPQCNASLTRRAINRLNVATFDPALGKNIQQPKRVPILVNYSVGGKKFDKYIDDDDLSILQRIQAYPFPDAAPTISMMNISEDGAAWGDEWRAGVASFTHIHHLFLYRQLIALSEIWKRLMQVKDRRIRLFCAYLFEQAIPGMSLMNRFAPTHFSQVNRYMSGRIRTLSQHSECSPWYILDGKLDRLRKAFARRVSIPEHAFITTGTCSNFLVQTNSVDYIFTDPPFGDNFAYSELNFIPESWHGVFTNQAPEAIVSSFQDKKTHDYQQLMYDCFCEYYRVLKPGRWMTVVFSNSANSIWHAIQEAIGAAGFVVADVRTLDKKQGTFNQVHGVSVNQDLIISAYKPTEALTENFQLGATSVGSVWSFITEHLGNVPVFVGKDRKADIVAERTPQMLHDRMIAFFVQHGVAVPISGPAFFSGLDERYPKRDGMYFLHDQVSEYDRKRTTVSELQQLDLFVTDEASATQWVRQQLHSKPQSFQDLQPQFMQQLQSWAKHEKTIELKEILELNFFCYQGDGSVPSQIHSHLSTNFKDLRKLDKEDAKLKAKAMGRWYVPDPNKEGDLERFRLRTLLNEFEEYRLSPSRKIKQFRTEAVRAGFKNCYDEQDYQTIVDIAAKLPEQVIQEDEKLLMYYDVATMRLGD
jgi:predicted RNA-binding Zn-ribbon protein involved in translation (DUF1610 family)/16S rRNA G966 N2-methylase RsmD